jgi:hypothetical protein
MGADDDDRQILEHLLARDDRRRGDYSCSAVSSARARRSTDSATMGS